jgi:hypothetical protein
MSFKDKITSVAGRQLLTAQKHSPVLMFGAGVIGVIATVVLACNATLKMESVMDEAEENEKQIKGSVDKPLEDGGTYTEEDAKKDGVTNKIKTVVKIGQLYAPAVGVGLISIGLLTGSHIIMRRRYAGVVAAYAIVDQSFKDYRGRVIADQGREKDLEYRFGSETKEIAVDTDEGPVPKTVKILSKNGHSMYAKLFAEETNENWSPIRMKNSTFIQAQQNWANNWLNAHGYLFLNDVYKMLGFEPTSYGQVVGWVKDNPNGGDSYVDFGIVDGRGGLEFVAGDERSVWLDFNVDGVVLDMLDNKVAEKKRYRL